MFIEKSVLNHMFYASFEPYELSNMISTILGVMESNGDIEGSWKVNSKIHKKNCMLEALCFLQFHGCMLSFAP